VCALVTDLAQRYPLRAIQLEAAHHMPFIHGFHHEMQQQAITPALQVLLGLCFCPACVEQARLSGVDGERVRRFVASEIEALLQNETDSIGEVAWKLPYWHDRLDGELTRYLALRHESVYQLWAEVHQAVQAVSTVPVHLQDPSSNGVQRLSAPDLAWLAGLEIPPREGMADGVTMLGYIADMRTFQREVDVYCTRLPPTVPLEVGLRPALPDCQSVDELTAKVAYCAKRNVAGVSFYNYGMLSASRFGWIRHALSTHS
jgi:hypothetical protein